MIQVGSEGVFEWRTVSAGQRRASMLDGPGPGGARLIGPFPVSNWHFRRVEERFWPGVAYPITDCGMLSWFKSRQLSSNSNIDRCPALTGGYRLGGDQPPTTNVGIQRCC